ncbi:MAG: Vms1/Ankzf1 family peptidyl-tRNA hydrolase, partial [Candidatus Aenigmatarchaeota archaeon]
LDKTQDLELNLMRKVNNIESETGKILFTDKDRIIKILVKPPLPIENEEWKRDEKFHLESMEKIIDESTFGLVFLSSGGSALAKVGEEIKKFKKIRSDIKGQHSKGGFSQQRFQRNREKAVEKHLEEVEEEMDKFFDEEPKYLMISGVHRHVKKFKENLKTQAITFEKKLDFSTIDSKKELESSLKKLWESEMIEI